MRKAIGRPSVGYVLAVLGLGLTVSGCASAAPGGPSISSIQASPSGQTASYAAADLIVDQVVPAGGSVDVPVTFEGSSSGSVQVVSNALVAATFGGTALDGTATATYTAITTAVENPTDGPVHVVNQGTTDATVTPVSSTVDKGGTINFDAIVSEATAADGASAYLQDPSGAKTPVALTKVGTGHWTAQVSPTLSGTYEVHVQTTGARVRYGTAGISVSTGNISIGSGFTEQLLDTDGDGLANQLEITASVTALSPGSYLMTADLADSHGTEVSSGSSGAVSLVSGTQPVSIAFDGASIYKSGLPGPYHFVNVRLTNESNYRDTVQLADDLGATKAYDYHTFQH
jgi:acylphosphatase